MDKLMPTIGLLFLVAFIAVLKIRKQKESDALSENPIGEAEVYLAYGRKKEAKEILEKHLLSNPGDLKALELLKQAN